MLIPLEWLAEYVKIEDPPEALAERLTLAGLEVEEIRASEGGPVFDVKVTPNRGDWLSVLGVAREVAALTGQAVTRPGTELAAGGAPAEGLSVEIEAPDLCRRYVARLIRNVRHTASPDWMQRRLTAAGLRPINAVVDITNYVMLEYGQPLHAFDYDLLQEGRIVVRRAREGETIVTIDGTEVRLTSEMLVIADGRDPVAVAGVMGGGESEVTERTRTVLLESAHFEPASVRRTAKTIPLATAASYRFERMVDPDGVAAAADRAAQLIAELAGGEVSETVIDAYPRRWERPRIRFRPERARALLGIDIGDAQMERSLNRLSIFVARENSEVWTGRPPSWRSDLSLEEDLIEEVGRLHGYDQLPDCLPGGTVGVGKTSALENLSRTVRDRLLALGFHDAATSTLLSRGWVEASDFTSSPAWPVASSRLVTLRNPLSEEFDTMRPSLLPGLLAALERNRRYGAEDIFLAEIGWAHVHRGEHHGSEDRLMAAAVLSGSRYGSVWNADKKWAADFYTAKGVVEQLFEALYVPDAVAERTEHPALHPGRAAHFRVDDRVVAACGELHPDAARRMDLPGGVYVLEVDLSALLPLAGDWGHFVSPSRFPPALRDLSLIVPNDVSAAQVEDILRSELGDWLREVRVFDVYRGKPLPEDRTNLGFRLRLGSEERTLTDEEVEARMSRVRERLAAEVGAEVRAG